MFTLGLDIGATTIKSAVVNEKGKIKEFKKTKNRFAEGEDFLVCQIASLINGYREKFEFDKVGIGFAGYVNQKRGVVISAPNMGSIQNLYITKTLERKCDVSIIIDNDAHCLGLAENKFGAGKNYKNIIAITLGTGIGGAIIIEKKLYRGADNSAGEIGHMTIEMSSNKLCGCGGYGHFETFASGAALSNLYEEATGQKVENELIAEMASRGEKIAQKCIIQVGHYFALGLANVINIFNPEIIIVGGGFAYVDLLWQTAMNNIKRYLLHKDLEKTNIVRSNLGEAGGVIGAALLCEEKNE
ncbi:MAG: ROK family protein [bacterium]